MKKSLFFVALGALALTSCSQDEVLEVQKDAVSFSVVADNAGRGTVTNTNSITEFNVTAFNAGENGVNNTTFMNGVDVTKNDAGVWTYASTKFWPTEGKINFYSYSPLSLESNVAITNAEQKITYSVPTTCAEQIDVLYALNTGLGKADGEVKVNFRHALSQVVFKAKNTKSDLEVVVKGVRVVNLKSNGVLSWPTAATTTQLTTDAGTNTETDNSWGTWNLTGAAIKSYPAAMSTSAPITLNGVTPDNNIPTLSGDALLLMPQPLTPAAKDATTGDMVFSKNTSFFAIDCTIYSVEGNVKTLLWPSTEGSAEVVIPVDSPDTDTQGNKVWKQGRRYVYTFVFGEGAGYVGPNGPDPVDPADPDAPDPTKPVDPSDPDSENPEGNVPTDPNSPGDPVLVPVTFTVTVDMFQTATQVVDMDTK